MLYCDKIILLLIDDPHLNMIVNLLNVIYSQSLWVFKLFALTIFTKYWNLGHQVPPNLKQIVVALVL